MQALTAGHESKADLLDLGRKLESLSSDFLQSSDLEVQERASSVVQVIQHFITLLEEDVEGVNPDDLIIFFKGELNPVGPRAQKKVPVPEGLDLDAWINEPPPEDDDTEESEDDVQVFVSAEGTDSTSSRKKKKQKKHKKKDSSKLSSPPEPTPEELKEKKEARLLEQSMNPNYLKDTPTRSPAKSAPGSVTPVDDIPVQTIDLGVPLQIPGLASADQYLNISRESSELGDKKKKKKKKRKKSVQNSSSDDNDEGTSAPVHVVRKNLEMPEGAEASDGDDNDVAGHLAKDDPHRALADVRLDDLEYNEPYKPKYEENQYSGGFGQNDSSVPSNLFGGEIKKSDHHRKKKKKKEANEEEANEKKKQHKKEKKHKKDKEMLNGVADEEGGKKEKKKKKKKDKSSEPVDDVDLWLSAPSVTN